MPRLTALVLYALTAVVAMAKPTPEPKPWATGWDKPVDPKGDCSFERKGDRLTITVPGEGHELNAQKGVFDAPCLLRKVEGDFVVEVMVSGDSWVWLRNDPGVYQQAGILVMDKEKNLVLAFKFLGQMNDRMWSLVEAEVKLSGSDTDARCCGFEPTVPARRSMHLRVERRGNSWRLGYSDDGKQWSELTWRRKGDVKLPEKLKVGVFVQANAEGSFKAVFEHFKLSKPGK